MNDRDLEGLALSLEADKALSERVLTPGTNPALVLEAVRELQRFRGAGRSEHTDPLAVVREIFEDARFELTPEAWGAVEASTRRIAPGPTVAVETDKTLTVRVQVSWTTLTLAPGSVDFIAEQIRRELDKAAADAMPEVER